MIRKIEFDTPRKFEMIWNGVNVGLRIDQSVAMKVEGKPYPFEKTRLHAKAIRKLKAISFPARFQDKLIQHEQRELKEPSPQIIQLDEEVHKYIIELYQKVDWKTDITDEVVDILDWFSGAKQEEEK